MECLKDEQKKKKKKKKKKKRKKEKTNNIKTLCVFIPKQRYTLKLFPFSCGNTKLIQTNCERQFNIMIILYTNVCNSRFRGIKL